MSRSTAIVLAIDTAGSQCAVAVAAGEELLAVRHAAMQHGQAEALLPMVDGAMRDSALGAARLDLIAAAIGPGSFTGIRIGLAAASGIALAADLPLIGVSSFAAAAAAVAPSKLAGRPVLVALESRRADLFVQLFDASGISLGDPAAVLPEALTAVVARLAGGGALAIIGDAASRAMGVLAARPGVTMVDDPAPRVIGVARDALRAWRLGEPQGMVRPLYLRPPNITPGPRPPGVGGS